MLGSYPKNPVRVPKGRDLELGNGGRKSPFLVRSRGFVRCFGVTPFKSCLHPPADIDTTCPSLTTAAQDLIRSTVDKAPRPASGVSLADFENPFIDESEDPDVLEQPPHETD